MFMKNLLLFSILLISTVVFGQKNELGLAFFRLEQNSVTVNNQFEPKLITSIYFVKKYKYIQWYSQAEYGVNGIKDFCNHCYDGVDGYGVMKELFVMSGIGYEWSPKLGGGEFLAYVRVLAKCGLLNYAGNLNLYDENNLNRQYSAVGGVFELGVGYKFESNLTLRLSANRYTAAGSYQNHYPLNSPVVNSRFSSNSLANLSIGYSF